MPPHIYDVIIVGGGHAGCEAASAAARMGAWHVWVRSSFSVTADSESRP